MKKLFISAWNDSGGTYTGRLLDSHPDIRCWPYELQLGTGKASGQTLNQTPSQTLGQISGQPSHQTSGQTQDLYASWFRAKYRWPRWDGAIDSADANMLFDAVIDDELKGVLHAPEASKHAQYSIKASLPAWRARFCALWSAGDLKTRREWVENYIQSFLDVWENKPEKQASVFLGHCPVLIMDADAILHDFPRARILHVVRPALNCFADFKKRHPQVSASEYALKWNSVNAFAVAMAMKHPQNIRVIAYHDILQNPRRSINAALSWANILEISENPSPTWCNHPLDDTQMGPFGGVPCVSMDYENTYYKEALRDEEIETLNRATQGCMDMIERYKKAIEQ